VAVRIPAHDLTLKLLGLLPFPVCAPSANPSGAISPTTAYHVEEQLGNTIYILNGGRCSVGIESTIIKLSAENQVEILRLGGITPQQIQAVTGQIPIIRTMSGKPEAPGMLSAHYAPKTPLLVGNLHKLLSEHKEQKVAILSFKNPFTTDTSIPNLVLSHSGNLKEAAAQLFDALHQLDAVGADVILAEKVPPEGLGLAINDRLQRASIR
jgi:L-threonylcarbamoyladenylate synthase